MVVSGGLFSAVHGASEIHDGPGPEFFASLDAVFRDRSDGCLEVQIGPKTISP